LRILTFFIATITALSLSYKGKSQGITQAFKIYRQNGKEASIKEMADVLTKMDVIMFGEMHNNPIDHWLQIELVKYLAKKNDLILGAEMFERDDQLVLNEYLSGTIKLDHLKKEAKLWPNYDTDYSPLVEFAKENHVEFIATNVPRRYASLVSREGQLALDSLSDEAKRLLPPLPYSVDSNDLGYIDMREMMSGHGHGMSIDYLIEAQALKDYSMASSIAQSSAAMAAGKKTSPAWMCCALPSTDKTKLPSSPMSSNTPSRVLSPSRTVMSLPMPLARHFQLSRIGAKPSSTQRLAHSMKCRAKASKNMSSGMICPSAAKFDAGYGVSFGCDFRLMPSPMIT